MSYTPAAGAALGNELCAGTVAKVGSTKRIQELHAHWLADDLPNLRDRTYDPFEISDENYKELEGMAAMMKRVPWGPATSFRDASETAWAVCLMLHQKTPDSLLYGACTKQPSGTVKNRGFW